MIVDLATFVVIHTAISLIALVLAAPAIAGLLGRRVAPAWSAAFLGFALATSLTGFMFPFTAVTPAFVVGVVATLVLAATYAAQYIGRRTGAWRRVYAVGVVASAYLLAFVAVVQAFLKIPALNALAPNGNEPAFASAQVGVLALFGILGFLAVRSYRPAVAA